MDTLQKNDLQQLWRMFWRQKYLFAGVFLAIFFLSVLFLLIAPRKYEVEARLLYKENTAVSPLVSLYQDGMGGALGGLGGLLGMGANMDNQIALLSGLDLFVDVCKRLPPEDIRALTKRNPLTAPIRWIKRWFIPPGPPRPAYLKAAYRLRKRVRIEPVGASSVIRVVYRDTDRQRTLRIVKQIVAVSQEYSKRWMGAYYERAARALAYQIQQTQSRLDTVEQAFVTFQQSTHLLALDQQLASFAEWYSTLERMRAETETKMASLRAQLRAVDTLREHLVTGLLDSSLYRIPQARVLWDSLVVLRTEYVSLRIQGIDTTGARMQDLRRRIRETETQLSALLQQSLRARIWGDPAVLLDSLQRVQMDSEMMLLGIHAEQEALLRLQAQYEQVLDTLPDQAARYVRFQAKYQYLLAFLTGLRAQHDQLRILAAYPVSAYYTVQSPHIPGDPVSPKPILIFAVAVFVGVLSGTGVAVAYELMRNRVEHPDDLRDYGAPILAVVSSTMRKEDFVALAPVIARLERWLASSSSHPGILLWAGWIPMNAYVHWVEGLSGTPDRIPGIGMVWLTSPVATLDSHEGVEIVEPEEVMYRVLETPSSDVLIVHPADHPMDPVLQSLLVTSDAAVLVVRRGMSMDVVDQWMSLMGASGTEFLGWIFLQD